jgi:hypothetical protein
MKNFFEFFYHTCLLGRKISTEQGKESEKDESDNETSNPNSSEVLREDNKRCDIDIEGKGTFLLNAKVILALYSEILEREIPNELEFEGELFKLMCSLTLVEIGILFAKRGTWTALDVLMTKTKVLTLVTE